VHKRPNRTAKPDGQTGAKKTAVLAEWKATEVRVQCLADRRCALLEFVGLFVVCLFCFFSRPVSQQSKLLKSLPFHIVQLVL
jgi:hypothetical protein